MLSINNFLKTLVNEFQININQSLFFITNAIFSFSTFMVMASIPFLISVDEMAELSIIYNAVILSVTFLEIGITATFLRYYQIKKKSIINFSVIEFIIISFLIILGNTQLGNVFFTSFNLEKSAVSKDIFFYIILCQLLWIYSKNKLLSLKRFKTLFVLSVCIFSMRLIGIYYMIFNIIKIEDALIIFFIYPFIFLAPIVLINNLKNIFLLKLQKFSYRSVRVFFKLTRSILRFTFSTFLIGLIYVFTVRYLLFYLSGTDNVQLIADLGYSLTFVGIITIFTQSFRSFYISKFKLNDKRLIHEYLDTYISKTKIYSIVVVTLCLILSVSFYFIKPSYLTVNSALFLFINLISFSFVFLLSLITFLSKTMDYNSIELKINIVRFLLVFIICNFVVLDLPIFGFIFINLSILLSEAYFAMIVLKKVGYV